MFVSEIMSECIAECTEDMGLSELYEMMQRCGHGIVIVIESNAHRVPIGVVTERSICEQLIARGRNPRSLSAGSVMVSTIMTVSESDLVEAIRTDDISSATAIIVTDSKRQVCGLVAPEKLASVTRPPEIIFVQGNNKRRPRRVSEIPAFGWA